jgi:CHASE3 domain sensor protein
MKPKSPLNRKVQLAFGSAILTLVVVGALSYRGMVVSAESDRWVRHTHEVLESLADLLASMQNLQSSVRGFVLTGEESYAESYRANVLHSEQEKTIVANLTVDNPIQQRQIPILERLIAQKIQLADAVINLRRTKGLEAAVDAIQGGEGQRIMDEYRGEIGEMQEEEQRLLALRDTDAKGRLLQSKTVLTIGTLLAC